jgi:hypothetical protein
MGGNEISKVFFFPLQAPLEALELLLADSRPLPILGAAFCIYVHPATPFSHHPCYASNDSCLRIMLHHKGLSSLPAVKQIVSIVSMLPHSAAYLLPEIFSFIY